MLFLLFCFITILCVLFWWLLTSNRLLKFYKRFTFNYLGVRIYFSLLIQRHIFQYQFRSCAIERTRSFIILGLLFSLLHLLCTEVTQVILTTLTDQYVWKIPCAYWTVILEFLSQLLFSWIIVTVLHFWSNDTS